MLDEEPRFVFYMPPAGRRSLRQIGIMSPTEGGFPADAFGSVGGGFLSNILRNTRGPLASRWGTIMTRRLLASRTITPKGVNGADWAAERAWFMLRMGENIAARQLVQQVDPGNYSKRLFEVSMPVFLANADLSGMCPLAQVAYQEIEDPTWKMARPICASLAGEQGTASAQLGQAKRKRWTTGVDYLLSEKAVGAGQNGRRAVKIEWEKVDGFNAWRFGLAYATGLEPPKRLLAMSGKHVDGWRARLPMIGINNRMDAAVGAASLGILSNSDMVDVYAKALDDPDSNEKSKDLAEKLEQAYVGNSDIGKVTAMAGLWDGAKPRDLHGMLVLTARAAALIAPSADYAANADRLVASMMTAGLDTTAVGWASVLESGSLGWGILSVGAPGMDGKISYGQLDDFYDNDQSEDVHKSQLLLAGLAGLGRMDAETQQDFAEKIEANITRETVWSRAISAAAERGESGTVVLLAAAGMQGSSWARVPARHLYYITRSLQQVGLEAEARMIAAEAVTLG